MLTLKFIALSHTLTLAVNLCHICYSEPFQVAVLCFWQCRSCYVWVWCVIMALIVLGFDCNAWGAERPALWMLSDSCLPFNLAATHWMFLWDSLHLGFPTVLWLEGDFILCSSESNWSHRASHCVLKSQLRWLNGRNLIKIVVCS